MAISFVAGTDRPDNGAQSTSHSVTLPTGIDAGDLIVVYVSTQDSTDPGAPSTPSGYTQRWSLGHASPFRPRVTSVYRVADGSEDGATVTFTWGAALDCNIVAVVWRGVDGSVPFDATQSSPTSSGSNPDPNGVTTVTDGAVVFTVIAGNRSPSTSTPTPSSGYSVVYTQVPDTKALWVQSKTVATAGSENPGAVTWSPIDNCTTITDSLRPGATNTLHEGAAAVSMSAAVAAAGQRRANGAAGATASMSVAATGARAVHGVAALTASVTVSASDGARMVHGAAGAALALDLGASGVVPGPTGAAGVSMAVTATAAGHKTAHGAAGLALALSVSAVGEEALQGAAHASMALTVSATGQQSHRGAAAVSMALSVESRPYVPPRVYPLGPLGVEVDLHMAGEWVNATSEGVLARDPISIRRGRSSWAAQVDPAQASFTLDNRSGQWSPDNPLSPWHGVYVRNVPARIGVAGNVTYLEHNGGTSKAVAQAAGVTPVAGDIDLRLRAEMTSDLVDGQRARLAHMTTGVDGWEWELLRVGDTLHSWFIWTDNASGFNAVTSGGVFPWEVQHRPTTFRFTLDASTGVATFYYAYTPGEWVEAATDTGTATSIKTTSAPLKVAGNAVDAAHTPLPARVLSFAMLDGIDGTPRASVDFTGETPGDSSFVDDTGNTWTVETGGRLSNTVWRFHGELASLPVRWDTQGGDVWAPVEAAGILRRLRQGASPLQSAYRRAMAVDSTLLHYWPCEESGSSVTRFHPLIGSAAFTVRGPVQPATNTDFVASSPLPELGAGAWDVAVDAHERTGEAQVRFLMSVPADQDVETEVVHIGTTTGWTFAVQWRPEAADFRVYAFRGDDVRSTLWATFGIAGLPSRVTVTITQDGADADVLLETQEPGESAGGGVSYTFAGVDAGTVASIHVNPYGTAEGITVGHFTYGTTATPTTASAAEFAAHSGERAAHRIRRLCAEQGVPSRIYGDPDDSERLGPQRPLTFVELLTEAADTDLGVLSEAVDSFAVAYRPGPSIRNQGPVFTVDGAQVVPSPEIDRDDRAFRNDVTVENWSGVTAREVADGAMSPAEPPAGVGRYDTSFTVNVEDDSRVSHHAAARLALHAADEPRVSRLAVGTHYPTVAADDDLVAAVLGADLGDLFYATGLPTGVYPLDVAQIIQGISDRLETHAHVVSFTADPGSPWSTGLVDVDARYDTAGAELASGVAAGASTMQVATTLGPLWTTDTDDFPLDVVAGGVRVTVTAISGSTSPQTFTVTPATVVRAIPAGGDVRLADPSTYAL